MLMVGYRLLSTATTAVETAGRLRTTQTRAPTAARRTGADQCAIHHKGGLVGSDQREGGFAKERRACTPGPRSPARPRETTYERLWSNTRRKKKGTSTGLPHATEARRVPGPLGKYEAPPSRGSCPAASRPEGEGKRQATGGVPQSAMRRPRATNAPVQRRGAAAEARTRVARAVWR